MIIYNVTVNIDHSVHDEWIEWMKEIHIPEVMKTGMFIANKIYKILGDEDSGGISYSIQYSCESLEKFEQYQKKFAPQLQAEHSERYKNKFTAFRTLLEFINEFKR